MRSATASVLLASLLASGAFVAAGEGGGSASPESPFGEWTKTPTVLGAADDRHTQVGSDTGGRLRDAIGGLKAGDELRLSAGTYALTGGSLTITASGRADAWISIRGPGTGPPAIIDLGGSGELGIAGSYVLLEHVEVIHGGGNNVHIAPRTESVHDVIVRGCRIHALSSGPGAAIKVNRNNATNAGVSRIYLEDNDCSEAIGNALIDGVGVHQAVARGNHLSDNAKGSHGIFFKGGSSEILIERNVIRGIRGNAALQLGGNTGPDFFDPAHGDREGVDQLARNNVILDCDDAIFEVRGVLRGRIDHNTVVTGTQFAILRLAKGNASGGGASTNDEIEFGNNLVLSSKGSPQYARNDGGDARVSFGPTLWGGGFSNSSSPGPSIPKFPLEGDVVVAAAKIGSVLVVRAPDESAAGASAWRGPVLAPGSPALGAGAPDAAWVPLDALGKPRSKSRPTLGAIEWK